MKLMRARKNLFSSSFRSLNLENWNSVSALLSADIRLEKTVNLITQLQRKMKTLVKGAVFALALLAAVNSGLAKDTFSLRDGALMLGSRVVLQHVPANFALVDDPTGAGVFLRLSVSNATSRIESPLGAIAGLQRFTSCHRDEPWWMLPAAGKASADVKLETQWLLAETDAGDCVMLVPVMSGPFCFTLSGDSAGLKLKADTGDPAVTGSGGVALFVSVGNDPYALADAGARAVMKQLRTGKLRTEKPLPDFVNDFGWCTWNSFYETVSADKVGAGLKSFADGGVEPRFMILDDGWQDYKTEPSGEKRLVSLSPNQERFGGDLRPTVQLAKRQYKISTFFVWHAFLGYWGGVDGASLPAYDEQEKGRSFSAAILQMNPLLNTNWWGHEVGVVPTNKIAQFYNDYHKRLKEQGVDGVKVDSQSAIEGVAAGLGGRVALTRAYRAALEKSVNKYFDGRLINCMANAMETYYCSPGSTIMRTSIDFWPTKPETHGQHLYCNAQVGLWFGEFMQPDWDMFQSDHPMGSFHAAGRAVSGGPVYVSDTPDGHNFDLLKKLVLSDGTVLRADNVGRATRDCLFADVTREPVLLKVFNYNRDCAVIGIFNANYHGNAADRKPIDGSVSPSDVPGLKGEEFAAFSQQGNRVWRSHFNDREPVQLAEGGWDIVSYAPVERGVAILGLADKFNSTGAVTDKKWNRNGSLTVSLRDGGTFIAWTEKPPASITVNGKSIEFQHDAASGRLSAAVPIGGKTTVLLNW
jgi:raffinose synthase